MFWHQFSHGIEVSIFPIKFCIIRETRKAELSLKVGAKIWLLLKKENITPFSPIRYVLATNKDC